MTPVARLLRDLKKAEAELEGLIFDAPALPPAYAKTLQHAMKQVKAAQFASTAARTILSGGTPVPEKYR